jgi:membrane associated rhomboid family serine protease
MGCDIFSFAFAFESGRAPAQHAALQRAKAMIRTAGEAAQMSAVCVGIIFLVHLLNAMLGMRLNIFGIIPRTAAGLIGIVCSPFLHANSAHVTANCSALLILLFLLFVNRKYRAEETLLLIWLGSGFGTWLIGRPSIHIGASSIIYGLIVYLIAAGWWMQGWRPLVAALIVLFLYAGAFYGIVPHDARVSWEGHLSGAIVGWIVARYQHG